MSAAVTTEQNLHTARRDDGTDRNRTTTPHHVTSGGSAPPPATCWERVMWLAAQSM